MGGFRRGGERSRSSLRDVYVARTVQEPQKGLERFLNRLGRHLGPIATISTLGSTHLTFLESCGVTPHFRSNGYTPDDIKSFKVDLQQHLNDRLSRDEGPVDVDEERPLRVMNGRNNTLAINIAPNDQLLEERDEIERFLRGRFGELPDLRSFDPHISIGRVMRRLSAEERQDPLSIAPEDLHLPTSLALNGLTAYLGRIH